MGVCPVCGQGWDQRGLVLVGNDAVTDRGIANLSNLEHALVRALLRNPMTRVQLIEAVYSDSDGGPLSADNCLAVMIHRLKKKLGQVGYTIVNVNKGMWGSALYSIKEQDGA